MKVWRVPRVVRKSVVSTVAVAGLSPLSPTALPKKKTSGLVRPVVAVTPTVTWSQVLRIAPSAQVNSTRETPLGPGRTRNDEGAGAVDQEPGVEELPVLKVKSEACGVTPAGRPPRSIMMPLIPRE